ncbi:MAG TPA: tetratricopeptide repeat protein, partial [Candidatus Acidoferrum sp.]|nr:tetratricopeptide repeat protein [Candidatus Acidoferrum sp.]
SHAYRMLIFSVDAAPQTVVPKARAAALKALELDPALDEAHTSIAVVLGQYDWDWLGAEREHKRAIELNPNNSPAHLFYSEMLSILGRHSEAVSEAQRARALDPVSMPALLMVGRALFYGRQYDRAVQEFTQSIEVSAGFWPMHLFLGKVYGEQRLYEKALAELRKAQGPTPHATASMGYVLGKSGKKVEAKQILGELMLRANQTYVSPTHIANNYVGLGEKDQAFAWLEKGFEARDSHMEFLGVDPMYDSLRSDPRFVDLLGRLHLPH